MHRLLENPRNHDFAEYSAAEDGMPGTAIDMHKVIRTGNAPKGVDGKNLERAFMDISKWLPFAAEAYNISPNVQDFICVPTLIFLTDIPNANLCAFPFGEMSKWNAQAGDLAYRTWARKPTFEEHANSDHTKAKGVIFDSSMRKAPEFVGGLYRVILLSGWDRNRDQALASRISAGRHGFSMGAYVEDYECSACSASLRRGGCEHLDARHGPRVRAVGNKLVYRVARGCTGFEVSAVKTPAFRTAVGEPIG